MPSQANSCGPKKTRISPLTLAADDTNVYFHDGERLVSLNQKTGDVAWETEPVTRRESFTFNFGPRLVVHEDVVLYAGGDGNMISFDAKSGKKLWDVELPQQRLPITAGLDGGRRTGLGRTAHIGQRYRRLHRTRSENRAKSRKSSLPTSTPIGFIIAATSPRQPTTS